MKTLLSQIGNLTKMTLFEKEKDEFENRVNDITRRYKNKYNFETKKDGKENVLWNNEADAFKHTFGSVLMDFEMGTPGSYLGSAYHEAEQRVNPNNERNMDFWNNDQGRKIAKEIKDEYGEKHFRSLPKEKQEDIIAKKVMVKMRRGELITNPDDRRVYMGKDLYAENVWRFLKDAGNFLKYGFETKDGEFLIRNNDSNDFTPYSSEKNKARRYNPDIDLKKPAASSDSSKKTSPAAAGKNASKSALAAGKNAPKSASAAGKNTVKSVPAPAKKPTSPAANNSKKTGKKTSSAYSNKGIVNFDKVSINGKKWDELSSGEQKDFWDGFESNSISSSSKKEDKNWTKKFNVGDPDTDDGHWVTMPNGKHLFIKDS